MTQSQQRARPASFGRTAEEKPPVAEDFTIKGGEAFHLVLHVQVKPDAASLEALRAAIRETTRAAVIEGYAAAFAEMDDDPGPPPAEPDPTDGASPEH